MKQYLPLNFPNTKKGKTKEVVQLYLWLNQNGDITYNDVMDCWTIDEFLMILRAKYIKRAIL